ncbi:MAG: endolytic transglycosylase MltG [Candidatus Magasanikbacteria bacterium]|nr:endolytic transglycosylase MltG [Candidatus Magasanikbacteria bacterium]
MKRLLIFLILLVLSAFFLLYWMLFLQNTSEQSVNFVVKPNERVSELSTRLEEEGIISNAWIFEKYLIWRKIDRKVKQGQFEVESPVTMVNVAESLNDPKSKIEKTITIIPGWTIRDIADYFVKEDIASYEEVLDYLGVSATDYRLGDHDDLPTKDFMGYKIMQSKPDYIAYDGYLSPNTYRIYADAELSEVVEKLISQRDREITEQMYSDIEEKDRNIHEILTMASILEHEARTEEDKRIIADIFWRRLDMDWALQADSTVHYIIGKDGSVFTMQSDRDIDSYWNTYKYPGLPPGPIGTPSLESIMAAIYPRENDFWYFLTTLDTGEVIYSKTLEEHNKNVAKYLR